MKMVLCLSLMLMMSGCLEGNKASDKSASGKALAAKGFTGFDLEGNQRSCAAMAADTMCTMEVTPSDMLALKCREAGHEAFQCGCHDWLCSEKMDKDVAQ